MNKTNRNSMLIEEKNNGIMLLGVKNIISYKERCFRRLFSFLMIVNTIPLVYESFDWNHGVFVGSAISSETTAAATGKIGVLRHT